MRHDVLAVVISFVSVSRLAPGQAAAADGLRPALRSEAYAIVSHVGVPIIHAELSRFSVLESRASGSPRRIDLAFVRIPSTTRHPGSPIVWLAGGPGQSGTADLETPLLRLLLDLRSSGDVVVLDQRGTGLSMPRLDCPGTIRFRTDVALDRVESVNALETVSRGCAARWRELGVDLSAYNTAESAEDLEDLRRALGADKIRLLAGSYGTHLALAAMRAHEDRIERAALLGVVGPDHLRRSCAGVEDQLSEIAMLARGDPAVSARIPDLLATIREIRDRLESRPVTVYVPAADGSTIPVVVGRFDLAWYTRSLLSSRDSIAHLPSFYAAMAAGDFTELGWAAAVWRNAPLPSATMFTMRCASGASAERALRIARDRDRATFPDASDLAEDRVCRAWGVAPLPEEFRSALRSAVPTLFVSGTLDGDTPEENANEVMPGFSNAKRFVVGGGAHALLGIENSAEREATVRFLDGAPLKLERVDLPRFVFERPGPAGASTVLAGRREIQLPQIFGGAP